MYIQHLNLRNATLFTALSCHVDFTSLADFGGTQSGRHHLEWEFQVEGVFSLSFHS